MKRLPSSLTSTYLSKVRLGQATVALMSEVHAYRGKQELYQDIVPERLKELRQSAIIQSVESSNRLERIVVAANRLNPLINEDIAPTTRNEGELLGYKKVLDSIHQHFELMLPTPNLILQLHRDLMQFSPQTGGEWKRAPNDIEAQHPNGDVEIRFKTLPPFLVPSAMEELYKNYRRISNDGSVDKLVLIAGFVLDFLCIHPFSDGNGRTARLLTLLLLYRAGFYVGQYISLERIIEQTKDGYYAALGHSDDGWHDNQHNLEYWLSYLSRILLAAYHELDEGVGKVARPSLTQNVIEIIASLELSFTSGQIINALPHENPQSIRNILQALRKEGHISSEGIGRAACWKKSI
jgi:Fic family protein